MYSYDFKNKYYLTVLMVLTLIVCCLALASCSTDSQAKKRTVQSSQKKGAAQHIYPATAVKFFRPSYTVSVPGELKPYEQVAVYAKVSGFVKKLYVDRGDHVHKGQLLAQLEAPEMNQQYLSDKSTEEKLKSDYLYAKGAYDRLQEAAKTPGAVAQLELDRAASAMQSTKSAYEASRAGATGSAELQEYLRIVAPFDGVITQRNVSEGALAGTSSSKSLFMMAQSNKLRLTLSLPEKHAASVEKGMKAIFTVSSQPGATFEAKLSRSSGLLDQQDRSLTLEFDVDNKAGQLQGGDYAQVSLNLQRRAPSYWVPRQSVLNTQGGVFVLTKHDQTLQRIAVKEGIMLDSLTEVFGDLKKQDSILLKPTEEMQDGKIKN